MANFKRTTSLSGKFKNVVSNGETFIDAETGEEINVCEILNKVYGSNPFDISTSYKADEDVE